MKTLDFAQHICPNNSMYQCTNCFGVTPNYTKAHLCMVLCVRVTISHCDLLA